MTTPTSLLSERLQAAFDTLEPGADPRVRPSDRADFQVDGVLALAKRLGRNPREVAEAVVAAAELDDACDLVEVSGQGFVNLRLSPRFLAQQLAAMSADGRLGLEPATDPVTVVIDYSAPNVAKEMHVGHLRSTVIGDALCRMREALGDRVVRENHIGDWGTPFGMLIEHLVDLGEETAVHELSVGDLDTFYREARASFQADETFRERSRRRVVLLQSGDAESLRLWRVLVAESIHYFDQVYEKLGVLLTEEDIVGESFYNPMLAGVVEDLERAGLLVEDQGARCVFPPGFTNRQGDPLPFIVQKSDGGYGYAATDLAALRDRVDRLGAGLVLYVVGAPQSQHLEMCFAVARMAGWLPPSTEAVHVAFANVLGADRKMFKTRSGQTVKLMDLLEEAVTRAEAALEDRLDARGSEMGPDERQAVARAVGIGAVKYADLSTERNKDYVFDWDRMLAFEGNTGPYLQYAHARICSIFRRGEVAPPAPGTRPELLEEQERLLALALTGFPTAVTAACETNSPTRLCGYLYELASVFTTFYEHSPVLAAPSSESRQSRLALCQLSAQVLRRGLELLGIEAPERM